MGNGQQCCIPCLKLHCCKGQKCDASAANIAYVKITKYCNEHLQGITLHQSPESLLRTSQAATAWLPEWKEGLSYMFGLIRLERLQTVAVG